MTTTPVKITGEEVAGDDDPRYRAMQAHDTRFDGWFFVAVTSTRIYCRPSCPSVMPRRHHVRFYPTSAAAQRGGFRACKRCRPDTAPGSPEWNRRGDVVGRAMRSITDGVVDREGVAGLARRLGYSPRQLQRLLVSEVGAGPLELARAQRAETARILLETTDLRAADVAFAAGFGSVRQFNDTVRTVFGEAPTTMRDRAVRSARRTNGERPSPGATTTTAPASVTLRLACREPFPSSRLFAFLAARAVPGVEEGDDTYYRRALNLPHGTGVATLTDGGDRSLRCVLQLEDLRDLTMAAKRLRQLFDLDADPSAVGEVLGADEILGTAVASVPGLRVPGHVNGNELLVRAVIGQQVSVAGARTIAGRLAAAHGQILPSAAGTVTRAFPSAEAVAGLSPGDLPMPAGRARALLHVTELLAGGKIVLDPGADRDEVSAQLLALPGIGPWTVAYVRMRALGDPDAFLAGDLGVRRVLDRLALPRGERSALALAERWRPYRAYALQYLWSGLVGPPPHTEDIADHRPSLDTTSVLEKEKT
jgi:AraC family transcriptional regulator of adaptative response / DNA-3-methyladenine glycosylase II